MKSVFVCLAALLLLTAVLVECRPRGGRQGGQRRGQQGSPRGGQQGGPRRVQESQSQSSESGERGRTSHSREDDGDDNKACKMTDTNDVAIGDERSCVDSDEVGVTPIPQCDSEAVNVQVTNGDGTSVDRKIIFCSGFNITAFLARASEKSCTVDTDCNHRDTERTCSLTVTLDTETLTFCRGPNDVVELNELRDLKRVFGCRGGRRNGRDSSEENETSAAATTTTTAPVIP